ncbi:acetyl xylan esterase II precursor [Crepidotus variabilis]|uniref:Acetyl xylan esterase II n=1 Tax=Crepidotus variabilis TaxID=179855 RepID=A0A9P6ER18_9AGAR|nr:acetyl xylan esterase II precursor [Crepidotus variabilis]
MFKRLFPAAFTFAVIQAAAAEVKFEKRACPSIHVFGARETTVPPGYGSGGYVVNLILNSHPGSTAEAIDYPACGGQVSCGGISYSDSVIKGTATVAGQINAFNTQCPDAKLVLVGYSQGGQIMDNAFCGGGDTNEGLDDESVPIQASAIKKIVAAIFMGDPRYINGFSYNVGTCTANGFAPRPADFVCPSASKIQSYCDSSDPYCCNGNDQKTHRRYAAEYGQQALTFINAQLNNLA